MTTITNYKKAIKIELPNRQLYLIINLPLKPPNSEGNKRKSPVQWKDSVTDLVFKTATFYNCRALALKQRTLTCVSLKTISIITCCRHRERGVSCMQLYFNINSPRINKKVGNYYSNTGGVGQRWQESVSRFNLEVPIWLSKFSKVWLTRKKIPEVIFWKNDDNNRC